MSEGERTVDIQSEQVATLHMITIRVILPQWLDSLTLGDVLFDRLSERRLEDGDVVPVGRRNEVVAPFEPVVRGQREHDHRVVLRAADLRFDANPA